MISCYVLHQFIAMEDIKTSAFLNNYLNRAIDNISSENL